MADSGGQTTAKAMRVSRFRRASAWSSVDQDVREALPRFLAQPGLEAAWFGRRGDAAGEERILLSVWSSTEAEAGSQTFPEMLADRGVDIVAPTRVVLPVAFDIRVQRDQPPTVLRLFEGHTQPGGLQPFLEEARTATMIEAEHPEGPASVVVAIAAADSFLTATLWSDWRRLEAYLDGDIAAPLRSRTWSVVVKGTPTHYELVP